MNAVAAAIKEAISLANAAKYPVLSTVDARNEPRARPIRIFSSSSEFEVVDLDKIYFNTRYKARKTKEILDNNVVHLTFLVNEKHSYVSFRGTAYLLPQDEAVKYWNEEFDRMFYPNGPHSQQYAVFRIDVNCIEVLSNELTKYFGPNAKFPENSITSKPLVITRNDVNDRWTLTHPILSKL